MSNNHSPSTFMIYGGKLAFIAFAVAVGWFIYNVTHQTPTNAPTVQAADLAPAPLDDAATSAIIMAKGHVCFKDEASLAACKRLIKLYPDLPPDLINVVVNFAKFYNHKDPAGLLALVLFESKGRPDGSVDVGTQDNSSAIGPTHYLIDTFTESLVRTPGLIAKIKKHFPNNEAAVDQVVKLAKDYLKTRDGLLKTLKDPKTDALARIIINQELATNKAVLRTTLRGTEYLPVVVATEFVHVLTSYTPDDLLRGYSYPVHFLGSGEKGAPTLFKLIDRSLVNKKLLDPKKVDPAFSYQPIPLKAGLKNFVFKTPKGVMVNIDVSNLDPKEIYPALDKRLFGSSRGNLSNFYGLETRQDRDKDGKVVRTYKVRVPLTALQVEAELNRKWQEHLAPARALLDKILKVTDVQDHGIAPGLPAFAATDVAGKLATAHN